MARLEATPRAISLRRETRRDQHQSAPTREDVSRSSRKDPRITRSSPSPKSSDHARRGLVKTKSRLRRGAALETRDHRTKAATAHPTHAKIQVESHGAK